MKLDFMNFIFEHWQGGTIGLVVLAVVLVVGVVVALCKECKWLP